MTPEVADLSASAIVGDVSVGFESSSTGVEFVGIVLGFSGDEVSNAGVGVELNSVCLSLSNETRF